MTLCIYLFLYKQNHIIHATLQHGLLTEQYQWHLSVSINVLAEHCFPPMMHSSLLLKKKISTFKQSWTIEPSSHFRIMFWVLWGHLERVCLGRRQARTRCTAGSWDERDLQGQEKNNPKAYEERMVVRQRTREKKMLHRGNKIRQL